MIHVFKDSKNNEYQMLYDSILYSIYIELYKNRLLYFEGYLDKIKYSKLYSEPEIYNYIVKYFKLISFL